MSPRAKSVLKWLGVAAFYAFTLFMFAYITFPYARLKDRVVAEYNARQPADGLRLHIDELDGYWLSGVEVSGLKLVGPEPPPGADGKIAPRRQIEIAEAHARTSIFRWLTGVTQVTFGAAAFDGEVEGFHRRDADGHGTRVEFEGVDVGKLPFVSDVVGMPMSGAITGFVDLRVPEGKFAKADGEFDLSIADLAVGDGKTKVLDTIALPRLRGGDVVFKAQAKAGRLTIEKFEARGADIELVADGKVRLRDPIESSLAEMNLRFKFDAAYRNKNDMTKAILDEKTGLFDLHPKVRRSKRADGFYGWRLTGPFSKMAFDPAPMAAGAGRSKSRASGMRGFAPKP